MQLTTLCFFASLALVPVVLCQDIQDIDYYMDFATDEQKKTWKKTDFKVGKDGKTVLSGPAGIFDGEGDAITNAIDAASKVNDTRTGVCEDYLAYNGVAAGADVNVCINYRGEINPMYCNGKGDESDHVKKPCVKSSYGADQFCFSGSTSNPLIKSKCAPRTNKGVAGTFMKSPCEFFDDVMKAKGETCGYFCVGTKGKHLLQCPEGKLKKCAEGCMSKMETGKQCGKAACKAPAPSGYDD